MQLRSCLFHEKQAGSGYLAEQTKDPQITLPVWTNKLCTTSLCGKDSIFYANRLVTSMYWVVKWATLSAAQAYTHWPTAQEGPNERPKPIHAQDHPSAALQIQTQACLSEPRWKPTEGPKHNKHQSKPKSMQEGPLYLSKWKARQRWLLTWNHAKDPSPSHKNDVQRSLPK